MGIRIGGPSKAALATTYAAPQGAWVTATAYTAQQVVTYNGAVYRCTTAHTSGAAFDLTKWEQWGAQPISALSPRRSTPTWPSRTVVTTFQTGHGFTSTGAAGTNLNDTGDYEVGTQAAKVVTAGTGANTNLTLAGGSALDSTGKVIEVLVKVDDTTHLADLKVYAGSGGFANFYLMTPVASSNTFGGIPSGQWVRLRTGFIPVSVTGAPARNNLTDWQLQTHDDNTGNPVTVHWGGIWLVPASTPFGANGVVSLSYDDCWQSQWDNARPRLDKYGYTATVFPIVEYVGAADHMTLTELQRLRDFHGWDIGTHAFTAAAHNAGFGTLSATALLNEMEQAKLWLESNAFSSEVFSYPLGSAPTAVVAAAQQFFVGGRLTAKLPYNTLPPADPYRLTCRSCSAADTLVSIQADIDNAYANGLWLQLCFHEVNDTPLGGAYIGVTLHNQIIDYLATKGIPVRTITEVLRAM